MRVLVWFGPSQLIIIRGRVRVLTATTGGAGHFAALVPFARALEASGHDTTEQSRGNGPSLSGVARRLRTSTRTTLWTMLDPGGNKRSTNHKLKVDDHQKRQGHKERNHCQPAWHQSCAPPDSTQRDHKDAGHLYGVDVAHLEHDDTAEVYDLRVLRLCKFTASQGGGRHSRRDEHHRQEQQAAAEKQTRKEMVLVVSQTVPYNSDEP